jgi:hypothetical protein
VAFPVHSVPGRLRPINVHFLTYAVDSDSFYLPMQNVYIMSFGLPSYFMSLSNLC